MLSNDDDAVSSLARDLFASFADAPEAIEGSSLYMEYVSPEPLMEKYNHFTEKKEGFSYQ